MNSGEGSVGSTPRRASREAKALEKQRAKEEAAKNKNTVAGNEGNSVVEEGKTVTQKKLWLIQDLNDDDTDEFQRGQNHFILARRSLPTMLMNCNDELQRGTKWGRSWPSSPAQSILPPPPHALQITEMSSEEDEHPPSPPSHTVSVIIEVEDELVKTMKARVEALHSAPENEEPCTIYRVIPSVRDEHKKDYDPKIVSIGPFHRDKESLKPMELLKWRYLQNLLLRSQEENMLEKYIKKVRELEARARKKYAEVVEPESNAFVQMVVVDGCFIIELLIELYFYYEDRNRCQLEAVNWNLPLLRNDLLMLENQIPFFILESLFELSNLSDLLDPEEDKDTPVTFMKLAVSYVTRDKFESLAVNLKNVHHLLHLFQISLQPTPDEGKPTACLCGDTMMLIFMKVRSLASGAFFWLLSLFLRCRLPLRCWEGQRTTLNKEMSRAPRAIPSATELKGCGVKFKKKDNAMSFLDVTFRDGVMEMPVLPIQEGTPPFFRNLIAFEQCCPGDGSHFTSYAVLLDNLIDTAGDVGILKDCGIFESKLGQDKEVANLFNKLCKGAYLDYETHYLVKLFKDVKKYSEVDRHRWRAGLMQNYFGNPWAIISLIAAIFLLSLTVVQTFFSVYAYYRPPN